MSDVYDALLKDFVAMSSGKKIATAPVKKWQQYYTPKKTQPGYQHGNKESLKGNKNKLQISEEFIASIVEACDQKDISVRAAWMQSGTTFTLAAVTRRVKLHRKKNNF